jgi:general secretion pathway protein A
MINIICDHALLTAYVRGLKKIESKIVKECAKELRAPKKSWKKRRKKIINIREKFTGMVPIYAGILTLLLVVGGYFYYSKRFEIFPKDNKQIESKRSSKTAGMSRDLDQQKPKTASKGGHIAVSAYQPEKKRPPASFSYESKKTDRGLQPQKPYNVAKDTKQQIRTDESKTQVSGPAREPVETKKIAAAAKPQKTAPFKAHKLTINFPYNSNEFTDEAYEQLNRFIDVVSENPDADIIVKGYTSARGKFSYNKRLSEFRANIVKSYLVGQGVSPRKIKTFGMGPKNPVQSNATAQGRAANRRIEIELKPSSP